MTTGMPAGVGSPVSGGSLEPDRIVALYERQLLNAIRKALPARIKSRTSADDVLQSAYRTFFRRLASGEYEILSEDGLLGLLRTIAIRKAINTGKRHNRAARDVRQEVAMPSDVQHAHLPSISLKRKRAKRSYSGQLTNVAAACQVTPTEMAELLSEGARPEDVVMAFELLDSLSEDLRPIAWLTLSGCSRDEIAAVVGVAPKTVGRKVELIRQMWLDAK